MNIKALSASVVSLLIAIPISYYVGGRFGYWEYHDSYWLIVSSSLVAVGITRLNAIGFANFRRSCLLGFSVGWLVSIASIIALQLASDSTESYGIGDMVERAGWIDLGGFMLSVSLARFGWLPFLVMFGTLAIVDERELENSVQMEAR